MLQPPQHELTRAEALRAQLEILERIRLRHQHELESGRGRYRQLRVRHLLGAVVTLALVLYTAGLLEQVPGLGYGWLDLFGGHGSVATGGGALEVSSEGPDFPWSVLVSTVGLSLLLWFLPRLAENEEEMFRRGAQRRTGLEHARSCVIFGLVHLVMGVSLGIALALSVGGAYFSVCYLRGFRAARAEAAELLEADAALSAETLDRLGVTSISELVAGRNDNEVLELAGVAEATRAHLAYNALIIGGIWMVGAYTLGSHLVRALL